MTRWLPFPLLSLSLFAMWLLLNRSLAPGHLLLAAVLAFGGGLVVTALEPPRARLRRPIAAVRLGFVVLVDIVRSNVAVARIILGVGRRNVASDFVQIPIEMRAPHGLALLAIIITSTPGTLWVTFDSTAGILTIHVLDLVDEAEWIATVKERYERPLMEIFE